MHLTFSNNLEENCLLSTCEGAVHFNDCSFDMNDFMHKSKKSFCNQVKIHKKMFM